MNDKQSNQGKKDYISKLSQTFPDINYLFQPSYSEQDIDIQNALIIVDTNVLLLPYSISNKSLEKLKSIYEKAIQQNKLFIPERVAREFVKNRNQKLAEIHHAVIQGKQGKSKNNLDYPILENLKQKKALDEAFNDLKQAEEKYYQQVSDLADVIQSWMWKDPVSLIYSDLFTTDILYKHAKNLDELRQERDRRFDLKIPPGYKDSAKEDGGIYDLEIWLTVMELARYKKQDVIFVTEEKKSDWWNRSNGSAFIPRYELIHEFSIASEGKKVYILGMSRLLELLEGDEELIEEAKVAEERRKGFSLYFREEKAAREKRQEAIEEIKEWFFRNYQEPHDLPYESREGGYQYIWGGPFDAEEEVQHQFGDFFSESIIEEAVSELNDISSEWSGIPY